MAFGSRGGGFNRGGSDFRRFPPTMHKIKCSECGKDAEVPFKPREGTPVYCRDCFMKRKGITPRKQPEKSEEAEESEDESEEEPEEAEESEDESEEEPEEEAEEETA